jgi:hypothetical protein
VAACECEHQAERREKRRRDLIELFSRRVERA